MDVLAQSIAFQFYLARKRQFRDVIAPSERWQVIAAAAFGAALGSRLLGWLEDPILAWHAGLAGGKPIVGISIVFLLNAIYGLGCFIGSWEQAFQEPSSAKVVLYVV